ncbi:MAG: helix-turn-helix domain-containing protein [Gammaproteobacteria bacterium]|nr:helix-turn-helix domain-containing protein [Gammaproteobacteria bacterium]
MDIYDIRRINLRIIAGRYRTQKELADRCGWKAPYVSQLLRGTNRIGAESARKIEQAAGMPSGWLDTLRDLMSDPKRGLRQEVAEELIPISDAVSDGRLNPVDIKMLRQLAEHLMEARKTEDEKKVSQTTQD